MAALTIIALLLAVAFPTFVTQKSTAQATTATANVKQLVNAIESCAAARIDGTYQGNPSMGPDCLDPAELVEMESALAQLTIGTTPPRAGAYQVAPIGTDGYGYMVQAASESSSTGGPVWFAELHLADGRLLKLCDDEPLAVADRAADGFDSEGCSNGSW